jgi:hypothetical protein
MGNLTQERIEQFLEAWREINDEEPPVQIKPKRKTRFRLSLEQQDEIKDDIQHGRWKSGYISLENGETKINATEDKRASTIIWHNRPEGDEWPSVDNIYDVLSGMSFENPIVKTSLIFVPNGIWEITTDKYASSNTLEMYYSELRDIYEQFRTLSTSEVRRDIYPAVEILEYPNEYVYAFASIWKQYFRTYGLKIWFTSWPAGYYYIKSQIRERVEKPRPKLEEVKEDEKKKKKFKIPTRAAVEEENPKLFKNLKTATQKGFVGRGDIIKDEGLVWELFGLIGKTNLTKTSYLKYFDSNPELKKYLSEILKDEGNISRDILMSNIDTDEKRETLWDLLTLQTIRDKSKEILLEFAKQDFPREILIKHAKILDYRDKDKPYKFKEKSVHKLISAFWNDNEVREFLIDIFKYDISSMIKYRIKQSGAKTLHQLGCTYLENLDNFLDVPLDDDVIEQLLNNDLYSLFKLHGCISTASALNDPKRLLIDKIVNEGNVVDESEMDRVIRRNIIRYLTFDEYTRFKECEDSCDYKSLFPNAVRLIKRGYTIQKLHALPMDRLIQIAEDKGIITDERKTRVIATNYVDIRGKDIDINLRVVSRNNEKISNAREQIIKLFPNTSDLYEKVPAAKNVIPIQYRGIEDTREVVNLLTGRDLVILENTLKIPPSDVKKTTRHDISLESYFSQIRLEERNTLSKYFKNPEIHGVNIPAITLTASVTEDEIIEKIFSTPFEQRLNRELDEFITNSSIDKDVNYDDVNEVVYKIISRIVTPIDLNNLVNDMTVEKTLLNSHSTKRYISTDLEYLIYSTNKGNIDGYINAASRIDFVMGRFEWARSQDDDVKRDIIERIIDSETVPFDILPELIGSFSSINDVTKILRADLNLQKIETRGELLYGTTVRKHGNYRYGIQKLCKNITSKIPINRRLFKFVLDRVYIYDKNDLFNKVVSLFPVEIIYSSAVQLISMYLVYNIIYVLRWDGLVLSIDISTHAINEYKTNVISFFKSANAEIVLSIDGDVVINNNQKVGIRMCGIYTNGEVLLMVKQEEEDQTIWMYHDGNIEFIPNVENIYSDFNNVYFQRGIETVVSNKQRLYHKPNTKEFIIDDRVCVLENSVLEIKFVDERIENCYNVYNNFVLCYGNDRRDDNVLFTKDTIGYPTGKADLVYALG